MVYWHRSRILARLAKHGHPTPYRLALVAHISQPAAAAVLADPPRPVKRPDMDTAERIANALGYDSPFSVLRYEPD